MTHLNYVIFGSNNGLSPVRDQAIFQINTGVLLNGHLEIHFARNNDGQNAWAKLGVTTDSDTDRQIEKEIGAACQYKM